MSSKAFAVHPFKVTEALLDIHRCPYAQLFLRACLRISFEHCKGNVTDWSSEVSNPFRIAVRWRGTVIQWIDSHLGSQ